MRINTIFLYSLFISLAWHFILVTVFDVYFPQEKKKSRFFPVYYLKREAERTFHSGGVLPSLELPSLKALKPSLPISAPVFLKPALKTISSTFSPPGWKGKKTHPSFRFPLPSPPVKEETPIRISWKDEKRKLLSYFPPVYPLQAEEEGMEGTVELTFLVDKEGEVKEVILKKSSGYPLLDTLSIECLYRWRFTPGSKVSKGMVKFVFELER